MKKTIVFTMLIGVLTIGTALFAAPRNAQAHECGWSPNYGYYQYEEPREGFSFGTGKFHFSLWGGGRHYYRPYPQYVVVPAPVYVTDPACHETVIINGRPQYYAY